jgi:hypothetical protein
MKGRLRTIFDLIAQKEQDERSTLIWGKNSAQHAKKDLQADPIRKILSDLQPD